MKMPLTILLLLAYTNSKAQLDINISESNDIIEITSNWEPIQGSPSYTRIYMASAILKDTTTLNGVNLIMFQFLTDEKIVPDHSDECEINFVDGKTFTFKRYMKDSSSISDENDTGSIHIFGAMISGNCFKKLSETMIDNIRIITKEYIHTVKFPDITKLTIPNLSRKIYEKLDQLYMANLNEKRYINHTVFDPSGNKSIDKKFLGKYSGEWYYNEFLYTFDLFIKRDTSYIVWKVINDTTRIPGDLYTQTVNVSPGYYEGHILLKVCYDSSKPGYTWDTRIFDIKLSDDGKVVYGETFINDVPFGVWYGKREKRYN
jgi:hypothetical protein